MGKGRTRRRRSQRKMRPDQQTISKSEVDACANLRKWMVSRSSKSLLVSTFSLVPSHFSETGRGLKTKVAVAPNTIIISIPHCLLVTPTTVLNSLVGPLIKRWNVKFTPHQLLALFLLVERNQETDSEWQPFISSLPADYTLPHYFSVEELNNLPQHVSLVGQRLIQRSRHAHKQVLKFCAAHWKDTERWVSWEHFRWAWCTVCSRAVFLETEKGTEGMLDLDMKDENNVALCPYLDLLNHTSTARVRAGMNWQTGNYEIITDDAYQPHEQVFISYGLHDNITLFLHYGFTLPHNIHNNVCFSVDDFAKLREQRDITCWDEKLAVLRKHSLHRELSCTRDGVSWNLLCAMKILAMDWDQLQKAARAVTGETLSPTIESGARRIVQHLIHQSLRKCQAHLDKLPEALSPHLALAHGLSMDEHRILTLALQDITL